MELVIIYGQEATGKFTVAQALAAKTGFKLFHNHVSIDVAKSLYEYGDPRYDELVFQVRLLVFESAAKNSEPGLIFTWAYTHPACYSQFEAIKETLAPYQVSLRLVYLKCSQQALEQRVTHPDRTRAGKIDTLEGLHRQQQRKNCIAIPGADSLIIDNTNLTADVVAESILNA